MTRLGNFISLPRFACSILIFVFIFEAMPPKSSMKRKAANGYKMPEKMPEGTVLTSLNKKQFRIGKSVGQFF
jgi:hypothetical protein